MVCLKLGIYTKQNFSSACQKSAVETKLLQVDLHNTDTASNQQAREL
jgi:hypothetical protein